MLVNGLELLSYLSSDVIVEVLGHDCNFLSPPNRNLSIFEIFNCFAKQVSAVYSCHERLSFIAKLHGPFYRVAQLVLVKDSKGQLEYLAPLKEDLLAPCCQHFTRS